MAFNGRAMRRVINVSNRLPIKISSVNGGITYQNSEGGLATALSSVFKEYEHLWIGWPGANVSDTDKAVVTKDLAERDLLPVFLTDDEIQNYYEGFSNAAIWPLFHYFNNYCVYDSKYWESYVVVNAKFASEIVKCATNDDIIWIHDYQLMLLPTLIRKLLPGVTIGYFQHIPFPSYEIFRELPWRKDLLNGLLGADIIGFQTDDDVRHFTDTVTKVLKLPVSADHRIAVNDREVIANAFPISIDYLKFKDLSTHPVTEKHETKLREEMANKKLAISIDRLDYSKGILQRLKAFDLFLQQHPEWREQITLLHLVVPSRDKVNSYRELKDDMNRLISDINGRYSTLSWQPIRHFYQSFDPNLLTALYKTADIALITPVRDGMNLVSKEYVASNINCNGVLILSEAAGAAKELHDALHVNPNDVEEFAEKIYTALNMSAEEKRNRMVRMQTVVEKSDIFKWFKKYVSHLEEVMARKHEHAPEPVDTEALEKIDLNYCYANKRLILLDYDGTLVPFYKNADDAKPDPELLQIIKQLSSNVHNKVVIISGRDGKTLEKWLGHLPVDIVAEHGAEYKEYGKSWITSKLLNNSWKKEIYKELYHYSNSIPGTFIEEKAYSIAWHYRGAENAKPNELNKRLHKLISSPELEILQGNKVIEIKNSTINKGVAANKWISKTTYDFILAIGDDTTDEDMFRVMPPNAITIKVGQNDSCASYRLESYVQVRDLLHKFQHEESAELLQVQMAS
jgi:trehalose 6-phosphate synthase/phosphatase